jgi:hypothetical protein
MRTSARFLMATLCGMALGSAWTSTARADFEIGLGGGGFVPWEGNSGYAVVGQIMGSLEPRNWRFGGEFQYRDFETDYFSVSGVQTQQFALQGFFHYRFFAESMVTPYAGAGIGIAINVIDDDKIEDQKPALDVSPVGGGAGIFGIGGLELLLGDTVTLFGEMRLSADVQLTDKGGSIDAENIGGFTGLGGIRLRF